MARRRRAEQAPPQVQPPEARKWWLARQVRREQKAPPELLEVSSGSVDSAAERSSPVRLKINRQEVLRRARPTELVKGPLTKPARAQSTKLERAPSVSPDSRAALPGNPPFRRVPGAGPRTSPELQKPPESSPKAALTEAEAEAPKDSPAEADWVVGLAVKPSGTPAEQVKWLAESGCAASMCMLMILMMGSSAWAKVFPLRIQVSRVCPSAVLGEAGILAQRRPQMQHPQKAAAGVGEGLPRRAPASREAAPSDSQRPVLPEGCRHQHRLHQGEAILRRRQIPHPNSGVPARPGRNIVQSLPLKPPLEKAVVLFPASTGGPLPVLREQGMARAEKTVPVQNGRVPVRSSRKRPEPPHLPAPRRKAAEQLRRPARQELDKSPIQEASAVFGIGVPAPPGGNCPGARFPGT